ncbi:Zinc finger protein 782-like 2 [Homarus americanus]|uniref:Zinc finger protein 782-like 2 n=1 Tax=Homarus americanus TaxID=6706 RepID=A0A8J5JVS1_HOMAM|nr:Zinc finger protein 782-like 2 [Homarus americanus]
MTLSVVLQDDTLSAVLQDDSLSVVLQDGPLSLVNDNLINPGQMGNAGGGAYDEVARALQAGQVAQLGDNNGPYRCNVCNKELKTKSTLKNHFTSQTHQNKVCSATGWADDEGAKALRAGQVTQLGDNNGPYRCNVCNKELKTKSTLMRHFTSQTHQNKVGDATGGADDEVAKALRVGQVAQLGDNNGPYRCNVCNKELKTKSTLKRHFTSQTHQNKVGDATGGADDEVAKALRVGQVAQLGDNNGPYRCNVCNKELKTKSTLKRHFTSQTHQNKISSARPASPQHHGQQIPATKTPQQVGDATGGADDEVAKALRVGQVAQLGDNNGPYRCNVCNKELKTKSTLKRHFTSQTHQNKMKWEEEDSSQEDNSQEDDSQEDNSQEDEDSEEEDDDDDQEYNDEEDEDEEEGITRHVLRDNHKSRASSNIVVSIYCPGNDRPKAVSRGAAAGTQPVSPGNDRPKAVSRGAAAGTQTVSPGNDRPKAVMTVLKQDTARSSGNDRPKAVSRRAAAGTQPVSPGNDRPKWWKQRGSSRDTARQSRVGNDRPKVVSRGAAAGTQHAVLVMTGPKHSKAKGSRTQPVSPDNDRPKAVSRGTAAGTQHVSPGNDRPKAVSRGAAAGTQPVSPDNDRPKAVSRGTAAGTQHVSPDNDRPKAVSRGTAAGTQHVCGASGGADDEVEKALRVGQVAQLGDNNGPYRCNVCNKELKTKSTLKRHFTSQTHQNKIVHFGDLMKWKDDADQEEESDNNEEIIAETDDKSKLYMCIPCNRSVKRWDLGRHLESETHKAKASNNTVLSIHLLIFFVFLLVASHYTQETLKAPQSDSAPQNIIIGTVEGMETKLHDTVKKTVSRGAAAGTQPVSPGNDRPQAVSRGTAAGTQHVSPGNDRPDVNTGVTYERIVKIMATSKDIISRETLFSHELAPYPTALFDEGGEMRHTSKSVLKNRLLVPGDLRAKLTPEVIILDGSALLWAVPWPVSQATVSTYISTVVKNIIRRGERAPVLHVVFDRYYDISPKTCCRKARQKRYAPVYNFSEESLQSDQVVDKKRIISLIVKQLCSIQVPRGKQVIVTGPDAHPIQVGIGPQQTAVTHEEADVIMAYHMLQEAAAGHSPIRIVCDDTDVFLILAHHLHARTNNIPHTVQVSMESCTRGHAVVSINEVVKKHSSIIPNILAAHALTGCDTVSSFAGIGKITALKTLEAFPGSLDLGNPSASLDEVTDVSLKYVSALYNQTPGDSLNNMRATIFTKQISNNKLRFPRLSRLPPTMAAFRPHCGRAHYQTALWKSAGMPSQPPLDPLQYGWEMNGSTLTPVYSLPGQSIVPDEVYNLVNCSCKTACTATLCSCYKFTLPCTKLCTCKGHAACLNPETEKRRM